jgi:hypothetical protein
MKFSNNQTYQQIIWFVIIEFAPEAACAIESLASDTPSADCCGHGDLHHYKNMTKIKVQSTIPRIRSQSTFASFQSRYRVSRTMENIVWVMLMGSCLLENLRRRPNENKVKKTMPVQVYCTERCWRVSIEPRQTQLTVTLETFRNKIMFRKISLLRKNTVFPKQKVIS